MITGTTTGYNSTGSSMSRLRVRTSMAAKSVPTAARPMVQVTTIPASQKGWAKSRAVKRKSTSGSSTTSVAPSSATMPRSLPT